MPAPNPLEAARALVIGVAAYADVRIRPLPASVLNDVSDVATVLRDPVRGSFPPGSVKTLVDAEATRAAILDGLAWLAEGATSTRVLYFSGHGVRDTSPGAGGNLLPFDADLTNLTDTGISADVLTKCLRGVSAQRLLVLLDACHSAGAAEPKSAGGLLVQPGLRATDLEGLARGEGRVIVAACAEH